MKERTPRCRGGFSYAKEQPQVGLPSTNCLGGIGGWVITSLVRISSRVVVTEGVEGAVQAGQEAFQPIPCTWANSKEN